jgi:hypothetical protein
MRETSDAMPDPRLTTSRRAAAAREADGQCRGIGPSVTPDGSPGMGRGRWPSVAADAPVARPVVREADGPATRTAITQAATEAVRQDAAERATWERRPAVSGDAAASPRASSADLVGLLGHLQLAVGRYVCDRRQAGAPIERVLPEVKGLVREASAREGWHDPADALMHQMVGWTITAFYDAPVARHSSQEARESQEPPHVSGRG